MKSHLFTRKLQSIDFGRWVVIAIIAGAVGLGALAIAAAAVNVRQAQAMLERQKAAEIDRENLSFCERLGVSPGSPAFPTCIDGLAQIRRQHEERLNTDSGNFL